MFKQLTGPAEKANPVQPQPVDEIAVLKTGEYLLHVFIEETRGLRNPKGSDSTVDPIIEVKAFGKSRYSKAQKDVGSGAATFWGEHFFFEKHVETTFELEAEKVVISVLDHSSFGYSGLLGCIELNIPAIYHRDKHCIQYQWAALSGLTKTFDEVLGFIKFSVGVFNFEDDQIPLNEEKANNAVSGPSKMNVLYPPQIITQPYQIHIKVFRAEKLKKMDTFGKTDPYVHAFYGGFEIKSTILKITLDPIWNEELLLPASLPTVSDRVTVRLHDWENDLIHDNELMGTVYFTIQDILAGKYKNPFWVNIYGSHSDVSTKYEKLQNEIFELGTEWKGRLLLAIHMEEVERPIVECRALKDANAVKRAETIKKETFELRAEIHYGVNLPQDKEDYMVRIKWGPIEVATKKKTTKNRMIEFYESLLLQAEFPVVNDKDVEIPDVFIYLNDGKKDISYLRKSWKDFLVANVKAKPVYMKVDKGLSSTRDDLAGIIKMRMFISKTAEKSSLSLYGWEKPIQKRQTQTSWKIHLNIFQARDLISGDSSGLSDSYLIVNCYGDEQPTSVISESINPIWNERLEFGVSFENADDSPPIVITAWDKDTMSQDDFIGSLVLHIDPADLNPQTMPRPKWAHFKYLADDTNSGQLLYSICCYSKLEMIPRSPYIAPETYKYYINMKILGLRDLESSGIIPVRRAFIRFDVDSLRPKTDKTHLPEKKYLRTEPLNPGPNPNILTVINLDLDLPADPDYCPSMSCAVFDYILKGISQPLLGNFSIPLGDFMKKTSAEIDKRIEILAKIYHATQEAEAKKAELKKAEEEAAKSSAIKAFDIEGQPNSRKGSKAKQSDVEEVKEDKAKKYSQNSASKEGGLKPLLGRYTESVVDFFGSIKQEKGFLPGENENIKIDIYREPVSEKSICNLK